MVSRFARLFFSQVESSNVTWTVDVSMLPGVGSYASLELFRDLARGAFDPDLAAVSRTIIVLVDAVDDVQRTNV